MTVEERIELGYLPGGIKFQGQVEFYFMPFIFWILDNLKYDPVVIPGEVFRGNILIVNDGNIPDFLNAIDEYKISYAFLHENKLKDIKFYIDFDSKLFVSSYLVEVEDYLPDDSWKGVFDFPDKHVAKFT
ncbi:hypothetical protein [Chitinophaga sp. CF418]|uniref:hypothetical protein n=1 Tax=Chitinophaga sp. CF418 TaxID=1855287 RepID=UPI0009151053|nr:hypothetical protein [Chitinophaga sp. CF418]SHN08112.1 hypothetical protein SAMN05216311_10560 [Chitinophaga sp. CF418]